MTFFKVVTPSLTRQRLQRRNQLPDQVEHFRNSSIGVRPPAEEREAQQRRGWVNSESQKRFMPRRLLQRWDTSYGLDGDGPEPVAR